jgi:hypothetical protein
MALSASYCFPEGMEIPQDWESSCAPSYQALSTLYVDVPECQVDIGESGGTGGTSGNGGTGAGGSQGTGNYLPEDEPLWPMPGPLGEGGPNAASYVTNSVAGGSRVDDEITGLSWAVEDAPLQAFWDDASAHCADLDFDGHTDWRLPTQIELISLVDYTQSFPASDPEAFGDLITALHWSSTPTAFDSLMRWGVDFQDGTSTYYDTNGAGGVALCVRRTAAP